MLTVLSAQALIELIDNALSGISLINAGDRRRFRELSHCREELLRFLEGSALPKTHA